MLHALFRPCYTGCMVQRRAAVRGDARRLPRACRLLECPASSLWPLSTLLWVAPLTAYMWGTACCWLPLLW